ncbi:MAG: hypothetical protein KBG20_13490 [Caldilineaceae bacterium]|nr:hypothetical protein [Caldilineaceae bacterium]MBP8123422.1 hypothetical protein [Caldilineaceae bacterium]MBP9073312.1 hypothetical protein [Caldilineaceae bacterium]
MAVTNLDELKSVLFRDAKQWWFYSNVCGAGVLVLGIIVLVTNQGNVFFALGTGVFVGATAYLRWISDNKKGVAETVTRRFEMNDGLGWAVDERELREIVTDGPNEAEAALATDKFRDYYASSSGIGLLRMLENLEESARWSKRLSKEVSDWVFWGTGIVIALAIVSLILALRSTVALSLADRIGQVVITMFIFLFSDGYLRLAFDYRAFANKARDVELLAGAMTKRASINEADAITLLNDYQVARAQSPLIPESLYKRASKRLNALEQKRDSKK